MPAELIWDNANPANLLIPKAMGEPASHQLRGSPLDNLAELCGRVCYDSLGSEKSRSSAEYHEHIREVQHLSVYRHCAFTVQLDRSHSELFHNRPGVFIGPAGKIRPFDMRATLNLQHVIEWWRPKLWSSNLESSRDHLGRKLASATAHLAPLSCGPLALEFRASSWNHVESSAIQIVPPEAPEERWLSFYISGVSRGLTHELVRHGAYTAPSQRSTRYCDEGDSEWVWHPMIVNGWDNQGFRHRLTLPTCAALQRAQDVCQDAYKAVVDEMTSNGAERKQARGAARGVLGNALSTELIFSASLARWREIGALRNHPLADAEIRELFAQIDGLLPKD